MCDCGIPWVPAISDPETGQWRIVSVASRILFIWLFVSESDLMSIGQGFRPKSRSRVLLIVDMWENRQMECSPLKSPWFLAAKGAAQ